MSNAIGAVLGLLLFFGFEVLALLTLLLSAIFGRSSRAFVVFGFVAVLLMLPECLILAWGAGVGSATSGQQAGYSVLLWAIGVFILALFCYAIVGLRKCHD
jgi:hypothetical protein